MEKHEGNQIALSPPLSSSCRQVYQVEKRLFSLSRTALRPTALDNRAAAARIRDESAIRRRRGIYKLRLRTADVQLCITLCAVPLYNASTL